MRHPCLAILPLLLAVVAKSPAETLPTSERPKWLSQEGLVMAGSWEPLPFRVRRDGGPGYKPTAKQMVAYQREHSPEMIERLKALGVNFVMTHCYKGGGLGLERSGMDDAAKFSKRCHDAGLHVGVYTYSGAFLWEPFFQEIPEAKDWVLLDEGREPRTYESAKYRYYWNRNHPQAVDFYKKIVKFAVNDIGVDLIHLDNYHVGPGYDACSTVQFRHYLASTFTSAQRKLMGLENANEVTPPGTDHPNAFLQHAWHDFCYHSLANSYQEMSRYARSLRKDVLMECNPGGLPTRTHPPVDHGRLLGGGEAIWNEGFISGLRNGKLKTGIPTYKLARRMGNMVFRYVRNPMQMAEAMAFNLDCLGCICWFEYGELSDYPGTYGKPLNPDAAPFIHFYRTRRELFRDTEVVADVAVLRSFPSQAFGPAEFANQSAGAIDALIAKRTCFQIICDQHLAELDRYRVLVLAGCVALSDEQAAHIRRFVQAGGQLCVTGPLATHDEWMFPYKKSPLANLPAERVVHVKAGGSLTAAIDHALDGKPSLAINTEGSQTESGAEQNELLGLCVELTERGKQQFVHLVNYRDDPMKHVAVRLHIPEGRRVVEVAMASPERRNDLKVSFAQKGHFVVFVVPQVGIYEVAVVVSQ